MSQYPISMEVEPEVTAFFDPATNTISYVVKDPASKACAVVDSVMDIDYAAGRITSENADKIIAFIQDNGLELAWQIHPNIPDWISGDANRLRQILVNLVGNSIKFTEAGEIVVRVECEERNASSVLLKFAVSDTGIGIAADRLDAIFKAFRQADASTTRKFGGTGLGLAISSRLVELMNGRIWVESQLSQGSVFSFTAQFEVLPEAEAPELDYSSLEEVSSIIVDDNKTNRTILHETLVKWGMRVKVAESGTDALRQIVAASQSSEPVEIVITDLHMPGIDGFEMVQGIRQLPSGGKLPVVMLTSGAGTNDSRRCRQLGIARHLLKPVKQSELLNAVLFALGQNGDKDTIEDASPAFDEVTSKQILLAEDGLANQKLATALLTKWGHEVTIANDGLEAVDAFQERQFDLILMDVQMPQMDGLDATRNIRKLEKRGERVPIIAMTAHAMPGDREKCLRAGMDGYLSKPVRRNELYDVLLDIDSELVESPLSHSNPAPSRSQDQIIDWDEALSVVDGDRDMLKEIAEIAVKELQSFHGQLTQAIAARDGDQIQRRAHAIQGTLRVFRNDEAIKLVEHLQLLGKTNDLDDIQTPFVTLKSILKHLVDELESYCKQS